MTDIQNFDEEAINLDRALLWQYNEAQTLEALVISKKAWYEENGSQFWISWYSDVFDLRTANDFGLSVWSIILKLPLSVTDEPTGAQPSWGFGALNQNFGNGNFGSLGGNSVELTTEQARLVLLLRAYQITSSGRIPEINKFFKYLFQELLGMGVAYAYDNLNMTISYNFQFDLPQKIRYVFDNFDILPRPSGVGISAIDVNPVPSWGFGIHNHNFNNGNFGS